MLFQMRAQIGGSRPLAGPRFEIRRQLLIIRGIFANDHHALLDGRVARQRGLQWFQCVPRDPGRRCF